MSVRFPQLFRMMVSSTVLASVALWVGPAAADTFDTTFIAQINGAQETPPNWSPSPGVASFPLNKETCTLCYGISYTPLEGTEFLAHFHGPAAKGDMAGPGVASPILHNIDPPGPSPIGSPKNGCVLVSDKQQVKDLKAGLWYINIHTMPNHPAGEVRGQVLPLKIKYKNVPPIQPVASPSGAFLN